MNLASAIVNLFSILKFFITVCLFNFSEPDIITFNERGLFVKESVNAAMVNIHRRNGTDGVVSVKWRTLPRTTKEGIDFKGGSGIITFEHQVVNSVIFSQFFRFFCFYLVLNFLLGFFLSLP